MQTDQHQHQHQHWQQWQQHRHMRQPMPCDGGKNRLQAQHHRGSPWRREQGKPSHTRGRGGFRDSLCTSMALLRQEKIKIRIRVPANPKDSLDRLPIPRQVRVRKGVGSLDTSYPRPVPASPERSAVVVGNSLCSHSCSQSIKLQCAASRTTHSPRHTRPWRMPPTATQPGLWNIALTKRGRHASPSLRTSGPSLLIHG